MKLLVISLCTSGVMREHFITYCRRFSERVELYCVTNDNVTNEELTAKETLNVRYKRNRPWTYFSPFKLARIKRFIKRIAPDVVFVFTPHPVNIPLARFLRKHALIYQVHDPVPHSGSGRLDSFVLKAQHKRYYRYADKLLVAGNDVARQIVESAPYVDESKIASVPFGLVDGLAGDATPAKSEDTDVLFFGRVEYYKGLDILIEAMKIAGSEYNCRIVGKGDLKEVYGDLAVPENVEATGEFVPDDELADSIKRCKVVVLPYRDATGSMTVVQAFYYGRPVIATDVGVFPEYVGDGGMIVPRGDAKALAGAIVKMLGDDGLRSRCAENAKRIYAERFDMAHIAENLCGLFNDTLRESGKGDIR